jgi:hypothetical protein
VVYMELIFIFDCMRQHSIVLLMEKMETLHGKEISQFLATLKKQRTEKLYKLITSAKNEDQLDKSLLFKKLFGKSYSEKNDYLWRNEIRLLKEELENFLILKEHEYISKNNDAYNDWLLMHAYDKLKFTDGMDEKQETLLNEKDNYASYPFVIDACLLQLNNLHHKVPDIIKRMNHYPEQIKETKQALDDMISAYCAKINLHKNYYNWISYNHKLEEREILILEDYHLVLEKNPISNFYNNFMQSFTTSDNPNSFDIRIKHLNNAIEIIEPLYKKNKLLQEARFLVLMGKGRELSANGFFLEAHEILIQIKPHAEQINIHNKTVFYVNYITNLVKCKFYKEALHTLENEFPVENSLYKNMLLYSRLICYLYLRDTENLANYISYDLDAAPFPQNYVLKMIKSIYFYLIDDHETALSIINSLLSAKSSSDNMQYYQPISLIYKKLYVLALKNNLQKKWSAKDVRTLQDATDEFEKKASSEFKLVSTYLWVKDEIEQKMKHLD